MNYITTLQASQKWGISPTRITILAKSGRINGAAKIGNSWMIPENAEKPADARTVETKTNSSNNSFFRYPIFEKRNPDSFNPPLLETELQLKKTAEAFHACRFEESEILLGDLYNTAENKYLRIYALYNACMIKFMVNKPYEVFDCYGRLATELENDFPYKKEMSTLIHELDATLGMNGYFIRDFEVDSNYPYHESYLSHLANLCAVSLYYSATKHLKVNNIYALEFICSVYEGKDCYIDLQTVHFHLGLLYAKLNETKKMKFHFRKALEISEKYELYYQCAVLYYYYKRLLNRVLDSFSSEFAYRIRSLSDEIHIRYSVFLKSTSINSFYNLLQSHDYIFVFCAANGYSNVQVSKLLNLSQNNVNNRYSKIYSTLGLKSKSELINFYNESMGIDSFHIDKSK